MFYAYILIVFHRMQYTSRICAHKIKIHGSETEYLT
jgi:hypothetical protein